MHLSIWTRVTISFYRCVKSKEERRRYKPYEVVEHGSPVRDNGGKKKENVNVLTNDLSGQRNRRAMICDEPLQIRETICS